MINNPLSFSHSYWELNDDQYYCSITDNENKRVGWCKYYKPYIDSDCVCIEYIYISEDYQRKGYATQMVEELKRKYGKVGWNYQFTNQGRLWYESLVKKGIVLV